MPDSGENTVTEWRIVGKSPLHENDVWAQSPNGDYLRGLLANLLDDPAPPAAHWSNFRLQSRQITEWEDVSDA